MKKKNDLGLFVFSAEYMNITGDNYKGITSEDIAAMKKGEPLFYVPSSYSLEYKVKTIE